MSVKFIDNSDEIKAAMQAAAIRALEKCGLTAEGYAKKLCPVDTGLLRNSITHAISGESAAISQYKADRPKHGRKDSGEYSWTAPEESNGKAVYTGTNVEYAAYVELGTGQYVEGGRPTPWVHQDEKGNWHRTGGNQAQPFIKPAVAGHILIAVLSSEIYRVTVRVTERDFSIFPQFFDRSPKNTKSPRLPLAQSSVCHADSCRSAPA